LRRIAQTTDRDRAQSRDQGKSYLLRSGSDHPALGRAYRYIRKTNEAPARYEIDAAEAEVVRLVHNKYTVGGLSIGAIARLLRGMGSPTRRRVRWEPIAMPFRSEVPLNHPKHFSPPTQK
jgi:site-specific DNA recombinase